MPDDEHLIDEPDLATITTDLEKLVTTLKVTPATDTAALEVAARELTILAEHLEALVPEA